MRKLLFVATLLCAVPVEAQYIRPLPTWFRLYRPQVISVGGGGGGGATNLVLNTNQTPDTYYLSTDPLGNSIIIGEAADSGFDFAHAQATTPTVFVHSNNQSTTQWLGFFHNGTNSFIQSGTDGLGIITTGSVSTAFLNSSGFRVRSTDRLGFVGGSDAFAGMDAFITREGAGIVQQGDDVNGAATNQTYKAHDGITGTNIAGANLTLAGGRGTGAGAPGDMYLQTAKDLATGTTAQTLFDRHFYRGKAKALTEALATTFVTINVPTTLTNAGGEVHYCIFAADATNAQARCGDVDFAAVNVAGTVTCSAPNILGTEATALPGATTLTNTFTLVANGTACDFKANATSSLTETTLEIQYAVEMHGRGTVTP